LILRRVDSFFNEAEEAGIIIEAKGDKRYTIVLNND